MIEKVFFENELISLIIRSTFNKEGIEFFTSDSSFQQVGYMNRDAGYEIEPHVHNIVERVVNRTQEVLYIKSGKVRIDYYNDNRVYLESKIVNGGDVILLASGGHGFYMIEKSEIIEVKQGPYCGDADKSRFNKNFNK
jgi:hypothetical protein